MRRGHDPVFLIHLDQEAIRFRNREMVRAGAGLSLIAYRSLLDAGTKDVAKQAIEAEVPTYLITGSRGCRSR
jgi:hypothetical protein